MITIICGLIGAGKSTFAAENFKNFTDADLEESKDSQIKKTLELYRKGIDVAHITCFPTLKEECMFKGLKKKYIWINTPPDICKANIKKRGRRISEKKVKDSLVNQLSEKGIETDYNLSLIDDYMKHWKIVADLNKDIKSRGAVVKAFDCKGNEVTKTNESIKIMNTEQAIMLKIIQLLGLQEPVQKESADDYL